MKIRDKIKFIAQIKDKKGKIIPSLLKGVVVEETSLDYKIQTSCGIFSILKKEINIPK